MLIQIESIGGDKPYINTDQIVTIKEAMFGYKIMLSTKETFTVSRELFDKIEKAMNK